MRLYEISSDILAVLSQTHPETGELAEDLAGRLDALEASRAAKIAACVAFKLQREAEAEAIAGELARLASLKRRAEADAARIEAYLMDDLGRLGEERFDHPVFGFDLRMCPPSVSIADGAVLPPEYTRSKVEPDKAKIMYAHKAGIPLPAGVTVARRLRLAVRGNKRRANTEVAQ